MEFRGLFYIHRITTKPSASKPEYEYKTRDLEEEYELKVFSSDGFEQAKENSITMPTVTSGTRIMKVSYH